MRNWKYSDFENIMLDYKSGFKSKMKVNFPGKTKGEDYWPIKLKNKGFVATIPLNWDMAKFLNSGRYGTCETGHCIGWEDDKQYWNKHVLGEDKVPVYIIDSRGKWVVMIKDGNRSYEVWDKMNQEDISIGNKEPIPGFSIKKELLGSRMSKLYNDIRADFYAEDEDKFDMKAVKADRDRLASDIKDNANEVIDNYNTFVELWDEMIKDLKEFYEAKGFDLQNLRDEYSSRFSEAQSAIVKAKHDFDTVKFEDQLYTRVEMTGYIDKLEKASELANENYDEFLEDSEIALEHLDDLEDDGAPMFEEDYDDAVTDLEDYVITEDIDYIDVPDWDVYDDAYHSVELYNHYGYNGSYEDYLNYIQTEYEYESDISGFQSDINEFIKEAYIDHNNNRRKTYVTNNEVQLLFDNRDMY